MRSPIIALLACCVFTSADAFWPRHPDVESLAWPDDMRTHPVPMQTCPFNNAGCIFTDNFHAARSDCSTHGNEACRAVGADYCGAWYGYPPRRSCCEITNVIKEKTDPDSRGCPPTNMGCVFDDHASNTDCTYKGNVECRLAGNHYCGAFFGSPPRRQCCDITHTVDNFPEEANTQNGCPAMNSGCIYDDEVEGSDCFAGGNAECIARGADYCGGWYGRTQRRSCCKIIRRRSNELSAGPDYSCPSTHAGCIFDDFVQGGECTLSGNAGCKQLGADYCGAYFTPKNSPANPWYKSAAIRVCCNVSKAGPPKGLRQLPASTLPGLLAIPAE